MPITYSPLRYPGGKSQLYIFVKELIELNLNSNLTYIEPFAGGAGVAMQLLMKKNIKNIVINDFDPSIHSFWFSLLNHTDEFINLMKQTPHTIEEWRKQKEIYALESSNSISLRGGFATFYLNRTNVSGIINGGPIGGYNQSGKYALDCRFNVPQLTKKIEDIASHRSYIKLYNMDAETFIENIIPNYERDSTFIFFDPPYYSQGRNLYLTFIDEKKHTNLRNKINQVLGYKWILTYDKVEPIYEIYKDLDQKFEYQLRYSANNHRKVKTSEYLFASSATRVVSTEKIVLTKLNTSIFQKVMSDSVEECR